MYFSDQMTDSVVRSDASSSSTLSSSPTPPSSATTISALPYTAWRHIISQLPIRDVMSLYHCVPEENDDFNGTLYHAIEDPSLWKKLRFIVRRKHPRLDLLRFSLISQALGWSFNWLMVCHSVDDWTSERTNEWKNRWMDGRAELWACTILPSIYV